RLVGERRGAEVQGGRRQEQADIQVLWHLPQSAPVGGRQHATDPPTRGAWWRATAGNDRVPGRVFRQIREQRCELWHRARLVRGGHPLVELGHVESAVSSCLAEAFDNPFPVVVRGARRRLVRAHEGQSTYLWRRMERASPPRPAGLPRN